MDKSFVFVDLDNIYWCMAEIYGVEPIDEDVNLFEVISANEKKADREVREIIAFADFKAVGSTKFKAAIEMESITSVHVSSTNSYLERKNASDIELSIRAVEYSYKYPDVENYIIVSGDADMIPIIKYLKNERGKKVALYIVANGSNRDKLSKLPNAGFFTIEDELKLKLPAKLTDEQSKTFVKQLILELHQKEEYNTRQGNISRYPTVKSFIWNMTKYIRRPDGKRFCKSTVGELIEYAEKMGYIKTEYSRQLQGIQIQLLKDNPEVKGMLCT